ncbi:MAG: hypothetical protein H8D23_23135 [Candidatus Brocadiales bacterium]|nr:hypothetical protein [Candidatus Brocadiales bacterium]
MISDNLNETLNKVASTPKILWITLTCSQLMYIAVAYIRDMKLQGEKPEVNHEFDFIFYAITFIVATASILYWKYAFSDNHLMKLLNKKLNFQKTATNTKTGKIGKDLLKKLKSLNYNEQKAYVAVVSLLKPLIVCLALNQTIVILGLILSDRLFSPSLILPFVTIALTLNFLVFPQPPDKVADKAIQLLTSK